MSEKVGILEKVFKLKEAGTTTKTEVTSGVVTFLSMVYILAVNPSILSASGLEAGAIFTATAISAAFATLFMAFFANYPIALASGMGLNAYFAYSVCVPLAQQGIQDPWKIALTAVLVEGVIFILLSLSKFREALVNDIPKNLKLGISAGIGLFITLIGFKNAGIVIGDESTLMALGKIATPQVALPLIGLIAIALLHHFKITGDIFWGILITWVLAMFAQLIGWYQIDADAGNFSVIPTAIASFNIAAPTMFGFDFGWVASHIPEFAVVVFAFLFVDLFDTAGTVIGVAEKGNLLDADGNLPRAKQVLLSDAVGTVAGACLGTSTVTSYVESSAGVAQGGKTGLTSLTTAVLFILALVLSPLFLTIPSFATTPALVWVGLLMMQNVTKMDFESDSAGAIGGFLAIVMMPFTYSIANGIMFGILAYVVVKTCTGQVKQINWVMWVSAAIFIVRIATLCMGL